MANVSQIEDKNGVVKDIVDKGLDEKTSQNSIASSDYVLLEDTDGAYHKIAKAFFTEAVRSALGAVINSVAKGNDIAKVPVLDSNNDLGMGTLANLASVLGGIANMLHAPTMTDIDDFDRTKTPSIQIGSYYEDGSGFVQFSIVFSYSYYARLRFGMGSDLIQYSIVKPGGGTGWRNI